MLKKIFDFISDTRDLFRDEYEVEREEELAEALRRKQESLKKFNGKMHVSERGGLSLRFKSKADENDYYKHIIKSFGAKGGKDV